MTTTTSTLPMLYSHATTTNNGNQQQPTASVYRMTSAGPSLCLDGIPWWSARIMRTTLLPHHTETLMTSPTGSLIQLVSAPETTKRWMFRFLDRACLSYMNKPKVLSPRLSLAQNSLTVQNRGLKYQSLQIISLVLWCPLCLRYVTPK